MGKQENVTRINTEHLAQVRKACLALGSDFAELDGMASRTTAQLETEQQVKKKLFRKKAVSKKSCFEKKAVSEKKLFRQCTLSAADGSNVGRGVEWRWGFENGMAVKWQWGSRRVYQSGSELCFADSKRLFCLGTKRLPQVLGELLEKLQAEVDHRQQLARVSQGRPLTSRMSLPAAVIGCHSLYGIKSIRQPLKVNRCERIVAL